MFLVVYYTTTSISDFCTQGYGRDGSGLHTTEVGGEGPSVVGRGGQSATVGHVRGRESGAEEEPGGKWTDTGPIKVRGNTWVEDVSETSGKRRGHRSPRKSRTRIGCE